MFRIAYFDERSTDPTWLSERVDYVTACQFATFWRRHGRFAAVVPTVRAYDEWWATTNALPDLMSLIARDQPPRTIAVKRYTPAKACSPEKRPAPPARPSLVKRVFGALVALLGKGNRRAADSRKRVPLL
jgi:hypothetical protein